ncbi:hypothetical protein FKM82_008185 [Ascaphus truei]
MQLDPNFTGPRQLLVSPTDPSPAFQPAPNIGRVSLGSKSRGTGRREIPGALHRCSSRDGQAPKVMPETAGH